MKLLIHWIILFSLLCGIIYARDDIRVRRKRDIFRNNLRRKNKLNPLYDQPEKNFLEVKSTHIYNPSIAYRDFFDNNAMGTSTIYYSRLMWGGVIFLIMFILVSSIGVYLYVNNLEGNYPKKRHGNMATNYYVVNPNVPYS
ncbi:conserved Plasmodium protein, unknown function [Plasmodium ovale]|uniref:Uncharacterized protein n=1 Tax=Plasmodium ovale TaxID=36330 RepID=A0A1D3KWS4_PLAOA|nr:conserved Plasmodium protein, unknown function [Plasmodium ovale]